MSPRTELNSTQIAGAPSFLLYVFGHLRTYPLISGRIRRQWDSFSEGAPYLVFLHTWSELDHSQRVWYRSGTPSEAVPRTRNGSVRAILDDPQTNALLVAESEVDEHPGAARTEGLSDDVCSRRYRCATDTARQLHELERAHGLAKRHLRASGWVARLGSEWLSALPVVRTRPDVTVRTDLHGRPRGVADGAAGSGQRVHLAPLANLSALRARMAEAEARTRRGGVFGYRGPWWGGWGDIVYAARFGTISTIVDGLPRLPALLASPPRRIDTLPPFSARVTAALRKAHAEHEYTAEMVLMHYSALPPPAVPPLLRTVSAGHSPRAPLLPTPAVRALGLHPHFFRFCNVARYRLGWATPGQPSDDEFAPLELNVTLRGRERAAQIVAARHLGTGSCQCISMPGSSWPVSRCTSMAMWQLCGSRHMTCSCAVPVLQGVHMHMC